MSTDKVEKCQFTPVVSRLMQALGIKNEYNIAELLGFKKDTFSARKKRGALPVDKIRLLCNDRGINFEWVLYGRGETFTADVSSAEGSPINKLQDVLKEQTDEILEFVLSLESTPELRLLIKDLKKKSPDEVLEYVRGGRRALKGEKP